MAHTEIKLRRTKLDINTTDPDTQELINKEKLKFGEALYAKESDDATTKQQYKRYLLIGDGATANTELPRIKLLDKDIADKVTYNSNNQLFELDGETKVFPNTKAELVEYKNISESTVKVDATLASLEKKTKTMGEDGKYYAGASSVDGGAAKFVESEVDTESTTVYVTGVSAANGKHKYYVNGTANVSIDCSKGILKGAAWNDFAEFRVIQDIAEPGHCVVENGDGTLSRSYKRLLTGASIISDTYGMVIGKEEKNSKPIAVAGRVLAYADRADDLQPGDAVCADEFGLVSKMTRLEIILHPDAIVGYVSEIPDYDFWNDVAVNDRVWIKLK